jgi:hypothetical protein
MENEKSSETLETLLKACMDAQGYVIGVGTISSQRDAKGNNLLDFQYRRYHCSLEDTRQVVRMFQEALDKEIQERLRG